MAVCFGGVESYDGYSVDVIEGYDAALTRKTIGALKYTDYSMETTSCVIEDTIQIRNDWLYIEAYDVDFTLIGIGDTRQECHCGGKTGEYVVYPAETKTVAYAFDKDMNRVSASEKTVSGIHGHSAHTKSHAIWVIGGSVSLSLGRAFAYDSDLVCMDLTDGVVGKGYERATCSANGFALFAGAYGTQGTGGTGDPLVNINKVFGWDDDLVAHNAEDLVSRASSMASAFHSGYATFSGGYEHGRTLESYDDDLAKRNVLYFSEGRSDHGSASVGQYILLCGGGVTGEDGYEVATKNVEAFKIL